MNILKFLTGGALGQTAKAVTDVAGVFRVSPEAQAQRDAAYRQAALAQYAAEFHARANRTWFDALADGVNRLIRPTITLTLMAAMPAAFLWPQSVAVAFAALASLPDAYWAVLSLVLAFYFGGRMQLKGQDFRQREMATKAVAEAAIKSPVTAQKVVAPSSRPDKLSLTDGGARLGGMGIVHRYDSALPYGVTATKNAKPFAGIVAHHPAAAKGSSVGGLIDYISKPRSNGYMFGYHFVIDEDGAIYQTAPMDKRTNHIQGTKHRTAAMQLKNRNSIGISFHLASHNPGMAPNAAQMEAGLKLVRALERLYGGPLPVHGHGEIQGNKMPEEGLAFAKEVRAQNLA